MFEIPRGALYPVLPLRDIVVFPHMIVPLFVGREKSVRALEDVMKDDKQILLVTQKNAAQDDPTPADIYSVGTIGTVLQLLKLPDGTVKVLVEGGQRASITKFSENDDFLPGARRADRREGRRGAGARGAGPHRRVAVRAVHQAQQEDPAGSAGLDQPDRRSRQAGRYGRLPSGAEDPREAGASGDGDGRRAAGAGLRLHGRRDRRPAGGEAHPQPRQAADGEDAARVLPERTAQGDPEGAGRGGGRPRRNRRARGPDQQDQPVQGSAREGDGGAEEAAHHEPDVGRSDGRAQLPRLDRRSPGRSAPRSSATSSWPKAC